MAKRANLLLINNAASVELADKVARELKITRTGMVRKQFADGEVYHAFPCELADKHVIIIASTPDDSSLQELIDLISGARYWNALSVNVVIPYLGYSTMERAKPNSGEIPKGVTRARQIFRSLPNYVAFVDLHSGSVMHAHPGEIRTRHLWTEHLAAQKVRKLGLKDFVLVSPDYGFSKRVARLAGLLNCPHTAANKDRYDVDKTIVGQLSGVVKGKTAVICDDMIRTGGSMLQTVDRCYEAGAVDVAIMATHLVLAGKARKRFEKRGIHYIIGADTYPGTRTDDVLKVFTVAPLIAAELKRHLRLKK